MPRSQQQAISDGVYAWMAEHPISVHDAIEDGAKKGIIEWLDQNGEDLLRKILPRALEIADWNQEAGVINEGKKP